MLTCGDSKQYASVQDLRPGVAPQLSLMLQSAQCVFPQVALFLEFREVCRLDTASRDIIPGAWDNEVWHVAANNSCTDFFQFANLDKQTIREFLKHVVYTTSFLDGDAIVVDSSEMADRLIQFACQMTPRLSMSRSFAGYSTKTFFTRFEFDEEALDEHEMNPSFVPYSFPMIFDLGGDSHLLEMSWHSDGLKLAMHSLSHMSKAELCRQNEYDDDQETELVAFDKPLRVQLFSISSPVVLESEYILTHADVDVSGCGLCDMPSSLEDVRKALREGFTCMISMAELTQDELDGGLPCKVKC
jgi:hypothetical protein